MIAIPEYLSVALFLAALGASIYGAACFIGALISPRLRQIILRYWILNTFIAGISLCIILIFFLGIKAALEAAKLAKTKNEISGLQTALAGYSTEYSELPTASDNATLVKILTGNNARHIQFLSVRASDLNAQGELLDAWQEPLRISMTGSDHPRVYSTSPYLNDKSER